MKHHWKHKNRAICVCASPVYCKWKRISSRRENAWSQRVRRNHYPKQSVMRLNYMLLREYL